MSRSSDEPSGGASACNGSIATGARAGFEPCAAFGDYVPMPPVAIATSVFMEKRLTPSKKAEGKRLVSSCSLSREPKNRRPSDL